MKGRDHQRAMEHAHQYKDGTAVTLRLVKPWCDSTKVEPRIIHGDSAFGSVECALALRKKGLHFMGAVKTSSREYPKQYFAKKASKFATKEKRGGFIVLESLQKIVDGAEVSNNPNKPQPLYALTWFDKVPKSIISTTGSCAAGNPREPDCHYLYIDDDGILRTQRSKLEIPRPKMIEEYFSCFSNIDVHDHYRQGSLAIERSWVTQKWYHRIFSTILGICVTDAFYAYRLYSKTLVQSALDDYTTFIGKLAKQLIQNKFDDKGYIVRDERGRAPPRPRGLVSFFPPFNFFHSILCKH